MRSERAGSRFATGQPFTLNLQTNPSPTAGLGGQFFGEEVGAGGTFDGPFAITGP